jgi:hypothetical protein
VKLKMKLKFCGKCGKYEMRNVNMRMKLGTKLKIFVENMETKYEFITTELY